MEKLNTVKLFRLEDNSVEVPRFVEISPSDSEVIPMPKEIVNSDHSVFDGSDEWFEIMEFEVKEEGWKAIKELAEQGPIKFAEEYVISKGYSPEAVRGKLEKSEYGYEKGAPIYVSVPLIAAEKIEGKGIFLRDRICSDGFILKKRKKKIETNITPYGSDELYLERIVIRQEKQDGKNLYRVYSDEKIQTETILSPYSEMETLLINSMERDDFGILEFYELLKQKKMEPINCKRNYLLLSGRPYSMLPTLNSYDYKRKFIDTEDYFKQIFTFLYYVKKDGRLEEDFERIGHLEDRYFKVNTIPLGLLAKIREDYESLLPKEITLEESVEMPREEQPKVRKLTRKPNNSNKQD